MPARRDSLRKLSTRQRIHAAIGPAASWYAGPDFDRLELEALRERWRRWDTAHGLDWRARHGILEIRGDRLRLEAGERPNPGAGVPDPPGLLEPDPAAVVGLRIGLSPAAKLRARGEAP